MVKSNEFNGATLDDAIRKATAAYDRSLPGLEQKDACTDLAIELENFKREAARSLDRAEDLMRESEALADSARRAALEALASAAIAAAGAFGSAARGLRILKGLRLKDLNRRDWIGVIPVIGGGLLAGANAYDAVRDSLEARQLTREARQESQNADRLGDEILRIADEYVRSGCDSSSRLS